MSKIKMIGLDLDGTLLNSQKELTDHTRETLERAIASGVIVLPATGRPLKGIPKELMEFPGIDYALTANGARIVRAKTGEVLEERLVSYETALEILKVFGKYDALLEIYYDGRGYVEEEKLERLAEFVGKAPMANYIRSTRTSVPDVRKLFEEKQLPTDKVQAIFTNLEDKKQAWQELLEKVPDIEITGALVNNIEVNAKGVNKGTGLLKLGELLGINREEIMACGDGANDAEMVREAGLGVAMENAVEEVKAAADVLTCSNDEDGVARAIEKYVL